MSFLVNPYVYAAPLDPDCAAFLTATGITNPTISGAVCTLVISLKSASLWNKFNAIYPMVGGTATTHMYNLRNPANTNAAYRLQFFGGWTHSANGAQPNGTNGYADTFFISASFSLSNSHHFSTYCRTAQTANAIVIGATNTFTSSFNQMNVSTGTGLYYYTGGLTTEVGSTLTNSTGFFVGTTRASNDRKTFRNGVQQGQLTTTVNTFYNSLNLFLGARNTNGAASQFSGQQLAFGSIGAGLTDSEVSNFYTIVQQFQTTLGRQI